MTDNRHVKYLVLGAGPGGLQMGYFLHQQGRDYLIVDRSEGPASFFAHFPRHRTLISINKKHNFFPEEEFNWRHDWNSLLSDDPELRFTAYSDELFPSADDLCRYLCDFTDRWQLKIAYGTNIAAIRRRPEGGYVLDTADGDTYTCEVLLLALGAVAPMMPPEIEGIDLAIGYEDVGLDLEPFRNKRVAIIGQGNSAFETAEHISGVASFVHILAKSPIKFAWQTHFVGDVRAINNNIFDMYQLKSLHAVLSPRLRRLERTETGGIQTTHEYDYPSSRVPGTLRLGREYDVVIRCCGFKWVPDCLFSDGEQPDSWYRGKYPSLTPWWESTNMPDLFFVGGAMQGNDRSSASGFIHGFRYNIRSLSRFLEERYESVPYPTTVFEPFDWNEFANYFYSRVSLSSALFQLFGTLCDVLVVSPDLTKATLLQEVPVRFADELDAGDAHVLRITLEFGFDNYSEPSISFLGPSDPNDPRCAAFLHPVLHYRRGEEQDVFHFGDSLLARWDRPHGTGGAVMSYHHDFVRWVHEKLRMPIEETDSEFNYMNPFHPWEPDELANRSLRADGDADGCRNSLHTSQQNWESAAASPEPLTHRDA